jgi:hypothetical protein
MKMLWYYIKQDIADASNFVIAALLVLFMLIAICLPAWAAITAVRKAVELLAPSCATSTDCVTMDTWSGRRYELCPGESLKGYVI